MESKQSKVKLPKPSNKPVQKPDDRPFEGERPKPEVRDPKPEEELQGEGNYTAAKEYNAATRDFVQSGRVSDAARAAKPRDTKEASELRAAEAAGRAKAKPDVSAKPGEIDNAGKADRKS